VMKEGYGGREGGTQFDHEVIKGLLATEIGYTDHFAPGRCAREDCGKTFRPRREDNNFCSKACEFDCYASFR
jgi:hypothetical protein